MKPADQAEVAPKPAAVPGTALLSKALNILESIGEANGRLRINDVMAQTGYAKPTLYRILAALSSRGFVQVDPRDNAYKLGPRFTELSGVIAEHSNLIAVSSEPIRKLFDKYGESVSLGVLSGHSNQLVARIDAQTAPTQTQIGEKRPLYCTALGKILLAMQSSATVSRIVSEIDFQPLTRNTITDPAVFMTELEAVRLRGFSFDDEEILEGHRCVAVPVQNGNREVVAAISISAPAHRMPDMRRQDMAVDALRAAAQIGRSLSRPHALGDNATASLPWLTLAKAPRCFGIDAVSPDPKGGLLVLDGAGGLILRVHDTTETLVQMPVPIRAMSLLGDALFFISSGALWRLDLSPDGGRRPEEIARPDDLAGVTAMAPFAGGLAVLLGAGLRRLSTDGVLSPAIDGCLPGAGLKADGDSLIVAAPTGVDRIDPDGTRTQLVPLAAESLRAFTFDTEGRLWLARNGKWSIECRARDGALLFSAPMPVPNVSALCWNDGLFAGSDRWSLNSAQIDLAPLAGHLFRIAPDVLAGST